MTVNVKYIGTIGTTRYVRGGVTEIEGVTVHVYADHAVGVVTPAGGPNGVSKAQRIAEIATGGAVAFENWNADTTVTFWSGDFRTI